MIPLKNDRLLRAIWQQPVDTTPIWIMRQAGRYLPEYRAVRARAGSFMTLCKTPELACEVTLQPLKRFALDAAILFSDILTIPDAMGLGLYFKEGEGPQFERPIQNQAAIDKLRVVVPEETLAYVLKTVQLVQQELAGKVPLIGFCGSPWTVATYMVEGKANKSFPTIQKMLRENPASLHQLLEILAQSISAHLQAQMTAGVQVVMIFDTWGGLLNTADYLEFSLRYNQQVMHQLLQKETQQKIPIILFTKGGGQWLEFMANSGCQAVGLDWLTDIGLARQLVGKKVALQGNMDPSILLETPEKIEQAVARILASYGQGSGHIFNLGHGITPNIDPEKVAVLVEAVHTLGRAYHTKENS